MRVSEVLDVAGAITAEEFGNRYFKGNQWWRYNDFLLDFRAVGQAYDLGDGYEMYTLPLESVELRGVRGQFKALMAFIHDSRGNKTDEVVYLTVGDEPGRTLPAYTLKTADLQPVTEDGIL